MLKKTFVALWATASLSTAALAAPISFDLKDPKGVNNVVFLLDAPLESINGTATGISGTVSFDPQSPADTKGHVVVSVESMSVPNPDMKDHMMGGRWLDAGAHPEITFELASLTDVAEKGTSVTATAHGTLTVKGTAKEIEAPVTLTYLKDKLGERQKGEGDILVVRSQFSISRSDFGVNAGENEEKVSDTIDLRLSLAGFAPR